VRFLDIEACLMSLTQAPPASAINHNMGDREEEIAACRLSKRVTIHNGLGTAAKMDLLPLCTHPRSMSTIQTNERRFLPLPSTTPPLFAPLPLGTTQRH
jgi:hypothetical protein